MNENLFYDNIGLVYMVSSKYKGSRDDIIQAGLMGLFDACKRYDENKGRFQTYAVSIIDYSIKEELRGFREFKLNSKVFKIIKYIEENDFRLDDLKKKFNASEKMILEAINYRGVTIFDENTYIIEEKFDDYIDVLDKIDRKIILYRYKYNMYVKDISKMLRLSQSEISKRTKRALKRLFEFVEYAR